MSYQNVKSFKKIQAALESVRGTEVLTMTRWLTLLQDGGISWTYTHDREDAPETLRSFQSDRDTELVNRACTISLECRLSFEEAIWFFNWGLDTGNLAGVTTGSTPPGYTYAINPNPDADELGSMTLKVGDGAKGYTFRRFMCNTLGIRCNPGASEATWRLTADGPAIFVGPDSFDAPSDLTRTMIRANGSQFFLDTSSAIGTTEITQQVRSFGITVANNIEEKRFVEDEDDAASDVGRGSQRITGDVTMEFLDDVEFALMRANTPVKIRLQKVGPNIGATPTTDYRIRLDMPQAKLNAPSTNYAGNNETITLPWLAEKPTGASALQTEVVIANATVTA